MNWHASRGRASNFFLGLLIAVGFGAGGWFAGISPLVELLHARAQTRDWVAVPATVIETQVQRFNSGDADTLKAEARYRYRYADREYVGRRIGLSDHGSDNLGSWQARWHQRLQQAKESGRPIDAWVNPEAPDEAVLDRELRWEMLLFHLMFGTLFPMASLLGLYLVRKSCRVKPQINRARIERSAGGAVVLWAFATAFMLFAAPVSYIVFSEYREPDPRWFVALFPAVALLLYYQGWKIYSDHRRIGSIQLRLADLQPRVGALLQGLLEFERVPRDPLYTLRLYCERVDGSSSGDTRYERLWEKELELAPAGNRLAFKFQVPADLPPSEAESSNYFRWKFSLTSASIEMAQNFDLIVYPRDDAKVAVTPDAPIEEQDGSFHQAIPIPPEVALVHKGMTQLNIQYAPKRHRSLAWGLLTASAFFIAAAPIIVLVFHGPLAFALVFIFFAGVIGYFGLRALWQPFDVEIRDGDLRVRRADLFGSRESRCRTHEIAQLYGLVNYSSHTNNAETVYYKLYAATGDGRCLEVGSGIPSSHVAEALLQQFRSVLGDGVKILTLKQAQAMARERALHAAPQQPWYLRHMHALIVAAFLLTALGMFGPSFLDIVNGFKGPRTVASHSGSSDSEVPVDKAETPADAWFKAMDANRLADLKAIAAQGFNLDTAAENGSSALMLAATKGRADIALWLIDAGADVNFRNAQSKNKNFRGTPLMSAGYGANREIVARLLAADADVRAVDDIQRTPLHFVAWGGCAECIDMLVDRGALLEAKAEGNHGETPLMIAAGVGKVDAVRALLRRGADPRATDRFGKTAYDWAKEYNSAALKELESSR